MFYDEVIILHALYISCNASIDVMRFFVILQVFMIGEYCYFPGGTELQVSPVGQHSEDCQEFPVVYVVIAFCFVECF